MDSESIGPIIVTSEDAENALMLFPAEQGIATAGNLVEADARASDSPPGSVIERQHQAPLAGDAFGVSKPLAGRPASTFHFENWSLGRAQWLFEATPSTQVWVSAALVSAAALVLLVFAVGRDPAAPGVSRSTQAAAVAQPGVVIPPRTPPRVADTPPAPLLEATAPFSTSSAATTSQLSGKAAPAPRSRFPEIDVPRQRRDARQTIATPVPQIPAASALPTSTDRAIGASTTANLDVAIAPADSKAPSDPPPAPMPGTTGVTPPGRSTAVSAVPPVVMADTSAIQSVLGRYLTAFMNLDVEEAKAVWPTVNEKALSRAFASVDEQQFELNECEIAVAGPNADASCTGIVRYVQKVGSKMMRVEPRRWKFEFRNSDSQWFIENVDSRQ